MKDKKIFKKWWFWLIVAVIVLGAIGSLGQGDKNSPASTTNTTQDANASDSTSTLPKLAADDYKGKEGLIVYKDLKSKGYTVTATFENQALTDINGEASDLFEPLDPNKAEDKQSVDAFVIGSLTQDGDSVALNIVLQPTN